ncbi:MAG: hypothetical protein J3R72DRAFT_422177 [Linnemannia gamsii]|nr:MAG: hypothetical protein J3R72DRAFT_422177 [Linnemannia gamsii]
MASSFKNANKYRRVGVKVVIAIVIAAVVATVAMVATVAVVPYLEKQHVSVSQKCSRGLSKRRKAGIYESTYGRRASTVRVRISRKDIECTSDKGSRNVIDILNVTVVLKNCRAAE